MGLLIGILTELAIVDPCLGTREEFCTHGCVKKHNKYSVLIAYPCVCTSTRIGHRP